MGSPPDRGRSDSKDWLRVRGRSKSVTNFKNSANYQKFLFFERASAGATKQGPRPNIRPDGSHHKPRESSGYSRYHCGAQGSQPFSATQTKVQRCRNSNLKTSPAGNSSNTHDSVSDINIRSGTGRAFQRSGTGSGTGRASHMKFAYGRLNSEQPAAGCAPNTEYSTTRAKMVVTASRSMPISEARSRHRSEPRHFLLDEKQSARKIYQEGHSTRQVDSGRGFGESLIESYSHSKDEGETSFTKNDYNKNVNNREGLEITSALTEITTPSLLQTKSSVSDTQDLRNSCSDSGTKEMVDFKDSLPARSQSLLRVIPGYFNLQSRRWLSSPDVSLPPLSVLTQTTSIVISEDDAPVSPDSQIQHLTVGGSPECQSDCSMDIFMSRSNSPGAYSDYAGKENFDRCSCTSCPPSRNNLQLMSCHSPVSEPTDCCKFLSQSLSELTRQKSIASIHLTNSASVNNVDMARENYRKIHVIKTSHSTPILPLESSTRLVDEWLSSVVKLQRERRASELWAFPEDDPSSYFSDLPKSEDTHTDQGQTKVDSDDIPALPRFNNLETEGKQWSSTGTNTDISLNVNDVESCSSKSNSPDLLFYSNDSPNRAKPDGPISRYTRTKPLPDLCGPNCCVFHNDLQCSHVHLNNAYQEEDTAQQTLTAARQSPSALTRHVSPLYLTTKVARVSDPNSPGPSLDADGPGIRICITGEEGEATDRAALSTTPPCDKTLPIKDTIREIGASPHYIFPCSASGLDDDALGQFQQLSPRNSIGSICSTNSYKSSNADSAVDLGPPDDDHDFEFADFLAKHHDRRDSSVSENAELPEFGQVGQDLSFTLGTKFSKVKEPVFGAKSDGNLYWRQQADSLTSLENMPPDLYPYSTSPKTSLSNADFLEPGLDYPRSRVGLEVLKESEAEDSLSETLLKCSNNRSLDKATFPSSFRAYKSAEMFREIPSEKFTLEQFQSSLQFTNRAKDQYNRLSPQKQVLTLPSVEAIEDDALYPPIGPDGVGQRVRTPIKENIYQEPSKSLQTVIPELIISDHSGPYDVSPHQPPSSNDLKDIPSTSNHPVFSLGDRDLGEDDSDYPGFFTPISPSPVPPDFDFLQVDGSPVYRSPSVSSISSEWSTCSTCTVMSDSDTEKPRTRPCKQSSWRKIRSFILWSPFIQVFKKHRYPWIQLAGHQGNFHAGEAGSVLKKLDSREQLCFVKLMADKLKDCVPEYRGDVEKNGESYIQLQDLLCTFNHPCVMDVKMGVRTYLEDELQKARKSPSLRKDMYQKMIEIDTTAPTTEENEHKAVTKPRYMQWRDEMSSSVELGFRVEGIKKSDGNSSKDFKKTKTRDNIVDILKSFVGDNETIVEKYIKRLKEIMHTQETSDFFSSHEVIGSSLLFVHDVDDNVGVWMIDFGKTEPLPNGVVINHRNTWQEGNHEDGYLFGLDNLVSIFEEVQTSLKSSAV